MSRLQEIRDREQASTKGPWGYFREEMTNGDWTHIFDTVKNEDGNILRLHDKGTSMFIAHSKQDIPYLLDLVDSMKDTMKIAANANLDNAIEMQHLFIMKAATLLKETK